jgi:HlyD family secretion protein
VVWRKHIGLIIGICVVVVLIGIGFIPRPVIVDTAVTQRENLRVTIEEEGKTRVIDRFVISAPVSGFMRRIELNVGDELIKDQEIAYLEPLRSSVLDPRSRAEAEARVAATKAALLAAEKNARAADADAKYASTEHDRLKRLYESRTISLEKYQQGQANARRTKANMESAGFSVEVARFEMEAAEAAVRFSTANAAGEALETVSVKAPVQGNVLRIHHESEGVINAGEPILEIGDPLSLEVEVDVLSRDAVRIKPGMKVIFERWGGDEIIEGLVRTIEPVGFTKISALGVEEQRVLVINDLTSPTASWGRLGDGYRVEASFILWEGNDVLQIPSSALFRYEDGWSVFTIEDEMAILKQVEFGHRNGLAAEITSGLSEGEVVITHPGDNVGDGSRVRTR